MIIILKEEEYETHKLPQDTFNVTYIRSSGVRELIYSNTFSREVVINKYYIFLITNEECNIPGVLCVGLKEKDQEIPWELYSAKRLQDLDLKQLKNLEENSFITINYK